LAAPTNEKRERTGVKVPPKGTLEEEHNRSRTVAGVRQPHLDVCYFHGADQGQYKEEPVVGRLERMCGCVRGGGRARRTAAAGARVLEVGQEEVMRAPERQHVYESSFRDRRKAVLQQTTRGFAAVNGPALPALVKPCIVILTTTPHMQA
jgi:hypothetical protein